MGFLVDFENFFGNLHILKGIGKFYVGYFWTCKFSRVFVGEFLELRVKKNC